MLTNLLLILLALYVIAAGTAFLHLIVSGDLPQWLDRATAYGDGKLNWAERLALVVWLPAVLFFTAWHDKWPGIKNIWPELWIAIVLGRQVTAKDVSK